MITDNFLVTGQNALVTGASRGIGRATAMALAEAGADVAVTARTDAALESLVEDIERLGRRCVAIAADMSDTDALGALAATAAEQLGGLNVLVNNVGGTPPRPLLDTSTNMFERAFHFNVTTAFEMTKAVLPTMLAGGGGSVVNISSAIGRMTDRGFVAYGTAKGALSHMTRLMATECAPKVRVNAIAAGSIETSALQSVLTQDLKEVMESNTPLRRLGEPTDIALAVLYLCSPAGSFMTGKILEVDGGIEAPTLALGLADL